MTANRQNLILYLYMKRITTLAVIVVLLLVCSTWAEEHEALELNKPYSKDLTEERAWVGRYVFAIPQEEVDKMKGSKWFFYVDIEPEETNEWISTMIKISIGKKGSE